MTRQCDTSCMVQQAGGSGRDVEEFKAGGTVADALARRRELASQRVLAYLRSRSSCLLAVTSRPYPLSRHAIHDAVESSMTFAAHGCPRPVGR
jgi:hypothetical protein